MCVCVVAFGSPPESRASWILEEGSKFIERKIIRSSKNATEDVRTALERSTRPQSDNPLENVLQEIGDHLEDIGKAIERKIIEPGKDLLEDWKLLK